MAKAKTFTLKNARRASYIIGDSEMFGNDQQLSGTIKHNQNGEYDSQNERTIAAAREMACRDGFTNIRIVTAYYDAVCIYCGVIDYKKTRETIKPFKF